MSIAPLDGAAQVAALLLQREGAAAQLALGQVVQAKVLKHFEGSRYLVRILGQEQVVESAGTLRPGETLHGRVVGLGDKIELERLEQDTAQEARADAQSGDDNWLTLGGGRAGEAIDELFRRYRGTLGADEADRLRRIASRAARPERMAMAGLVLRKVGLPLEATLLQALYDALEARSGALEPLPEPGAVPGWWGAAQRVLNAQVGGPVAHRVGMLPLQTSSGEIAVDAAMFEEDRGAKQAAVMQHRKVVLALDTEHLGRVELRALMADNHVRVALATESAESTRALLRHGESLSQALSGAGWQVDEISYETRAEHETNGALAAAVEHLITPGSVSRLI